MEETLKPLFAMSFGPSDRKWEMIKPVCEKVTCQFCGKVYPAQNGNGKRKKRILEICGRIMVLECCGGLLDKMLETLGPHFFKETVEDYKKDPLNSPIIGEIIREALEAWKTAASNIKTQTIGVRPHPDGQK